MSFQPEEITTFMSRKFPMGGRALRSRSPSLPVYFLRNASRRPKRSLLWLTIIVSMFLIFYGFFVYDNAYPTRKADVRPRPRQRRIPKPGGGTHAFIRTDPLPVLPEGQLLHMDEYGEVEKEDLSVLLPVDNSSLVHLPSLLAPFFIDANRPGQVIVACPSDLEHEAKTIVETTLSTLRQDVVEVQVRSWPDDLLPDVGLLHVGAQALGDWVLILDDKGFQELDADVITYLLSPKALPWPVGPRGVAFSPAEVKCLTPDPDFPVPAAFLVPPFIMPSHLLQDVEDGMVPSAFGIWPSVGAKVAGILESGLGGLCTSQHDEPRNTDDDWCQEAKAPFLHSDAKGTGSVDEKQLHELYRAFKVSSRDVSRSLHFTVILPNTPSLSVLSPTLCRLSERGYTFKVVILDNTTSSDAFAGHLTGSHCHVHYDLLPSFELGQDVEEPLSSLLDLQSWLSMSVSHTDVVLYVSSTDVKSLLGVHLEEYFSSTETSTIVIPVTSLEHSEWLAELTLEEWRNWNVPKIELIAITDERPASLGRLLRSLQDAYYYGDHPRLTIHMEQTSGPRTHAISQQFHWPVSDLLVRHRVVHGGLLPAVVESWYPASNDSYGVFLEDDVEVSPMFYAWLKFTILRYRYGTRREKSGRLFGVSLYQPKYIELRPEGRRPFNATSIFMDFGFRYPFTPYLTQVPCSWGAVYFPEHWREFHSYITLRRSEAGLLLPNDLVENVRSSKWTRSWKRYFIELAYLRGYVMLYPNYDHFISLSTNHLEFGTHMHDLPERALAKKRAQFQVPLMTPDNGVGLLDLPQGTLPPWDDLPVLDLWGNITTHEELILRGAYRHEEVTDCKHLLDTNRVSTYNAPELLCLQEDDEDETDDDIDSILDDFDEEEDDEMLF